MSSTTGLADNSTAQCYPHGEANEIAEPSQVSTCVYELVLNNATIQTRHQPRHPISDSFENTVEFFNALELEFVDIVPGFGSFNKSVFDVGTSNQVVEEQLERLFSAAHEEQFEVGIESRFAGGLQRLCVYDPTAALQSLKAKLIDSDASSEVLAEILRWASRQEASAIRNLVVDLLSTGLHNASSLVRDAAALSLAYLDEDVAIVQLQRALEREKVPELREDLQNLIRSLEN